MTNSNKTHNNYPLPSNWDTFICTKEALADVYSRLMQFPILFDDSIRGDYEAFVRDMINPDSVVLKTGDYGICRISDVLVNRDAEVHLAFWDRRFRGRLEECQQANKWIFDKLGLQRLTIIVPAIATNTQHFIKALGFKREGVMRDAWMYDGKFMNLHVFGILREEVFREELSPTEVSAKETLDNGK